MKKYLGAAFTILMIASGANAAVLATIGDKTITEQQVKTDFDGISSDQKKAINEDLATRKTIVENAVNGELLIQAARKAGLDKDEDYQKALERFQKQYLASRFLQKAIEPKLTSGEVKKFFDQNKWFFDSSEVCAHHIVVTDEKEAQKILGLAQAKGTNFEELAKKHSADPTVQENKGNLGCFTRDKMVPEFTAAAFTMKKGEVKGPVRTMYGYHVIKIDQTKAGKTPNFEEVEQRAKETYRMRMMNDLLTDLRSKSNVKVNDSEVDKFRL